MRTSVPAFVVLLCLQAVFALASGPDAILGTWNNEEKNAQIEIFACDGRYCGRIVWLKEPNYPAGSTEGLPATPKLDRNNPDPQKRKDPVLGLVIVRDFQTEEENRLTNGTVYDPKNGKTYKGKITLISHGRLELRGYIGIPLIGRTTTWTR